MGELRPLFAGSIPEYYDRCLGPAWFDAYATYLAQRLPARPPGDVLEIACGTGVSTRRLRERLDPSVKLVATDVSTAMLSYARAKLSNVERIEWREADALALPYADRAFGAVVCAFGFMFVPDKQRAIREAFRVLVDGGILLFSVWDRIEENPHAQINAQVVESLFPDDAEMRFRIPYDMQDAGLLQRLCDGAGFREVKIEKRRCAVESVSARTLATGQIRGTPRSSLIEQRGVPLDDVIDKVAAALAASGGDDPYRGYAQAVVVEARR
jgi:SAM-dependent methyltransferase